MKIVIPGGSGHIGGVLTKALHRGGHDVVVLSRGRAQPSRSPFANNEADAAPRIVAWDGASQAAWADEIDGADAVVNLAGRSVNCRYSKRNLRQMMDSRIDSTRAVGLAIERAQRSPRVWLQMSTATIYAHRFDAPNDEQNGVIGGTEPDAPRHWRASIDIATAWERTLREARTPRTRKVLLRTAMVMSHERGGTFDILLGLTRRGLGGTIAGGRQFISWIHEADFARAVEWLIGRDDVEGVVNLAAPRPLPQREYMGALRAAWGVRTGLPMPRRMLEIGAFVLRTESELLLKSRRVVPGRLLAEGFDFRYPDWPSAANDLVARWRSSESASRRRR